MKTIKQVSKAVLLSTLLGVAGVACAQTTEVTFPDISRTYLKTGDFVDLSHLNNVGIGQTRQQIMLLLGKPHFNEGIGSPDVFNYVFNFYTNNAAGQYVTCQYQVTFDKNHRSSGYYWKDRQCENYAKPAAAPVIAPVVAPMPKKLTLGADGLFAFGKSGIHDLQEQGRTQLQSFAKELAGSQADYRYIEVIGYTDRIGSEQSNRALSLNRANTVKQYLVNLGLNGNSIRTSGMGASKAVVTCDGPKTPAVIQCLMPNRRIEVLVVQ